MLISIAHVSKYSYEQPARHAVQALRLTPPSFASQRVLQWSISAPGIEHAASFRDGFGNVAHLVTSTGDHTETVAVAKGIVETDDSAGVVRGLQEAAPIRVFLRETLKTKAGEAIRDLASGTSGANDLERLHALMNKVRDAVDYRIGATHADTSASEALAKGYGVCQDHAHVFIAAARSIGIPGRYVNGYFVSGDEGPAEAHHAWAEAYVQGLGWVGFDPANRHCPDERYVRLACGLDAVSAAPIRGSRTGGTNEALDVIVEVQQASSQQ